MVTQRGPDGALSEMAPLSAGESNLSGSDSAKPASELTYCYSYNSVGEQRWTRALSPGAAVTLGPQSMTRSSSGDVAEHARTVVPKLAQP